MRQPIKPLPELTESFKKALWEKIEVRNPDECWPWKGRIGRNKYGLIRNNGFPFIASRIVFAASGGVFTEEKPLALHKCDNRACCNPAHLYAGDDADNTADKIARNRIPKGANGPARKLTADQVLEIRAAFARGENPFAVAAKFNISHSYAHRLVKREAWTEI